MGEITNTLTESNQPPAGYAYPRDLAVFVRDRWSGIPEVPCDVNHLPDTSTLDEFFSACFHASMLREEERPVTFRAILAPPSLFAPDGMPPDRQRTRPVGELPPSWFGAPPFGEGQRL